MKNIIEKKDFEIIKIANSLDLLFYTPNSQLFPLTNYSLKEYFYNCKNFNNHSENQYFNLKETNQIFEYLNLQFKKSLPPVEIVTPKNKLNYLILPISGKCNLKCAYCFARIDNNFLFDDITNNEAKQIVDYLFNDLNLEECTICFFGGEPFLNLKTMQFVVDYITDNFNERNVGYTVTTNGTILNKKIFEFIKNHNISVMISIDGPKDISVHRVYHDHQSSFDDTLRTITKLKANDIDVELRATVTNDNIQILRIYDFFENLQLPFDIIFAYDSENKGHSLSNYAKNLQSIENQLNDLKEYYINTLESGKKINCVSVLRKLNEVSIRRKSNFACLAGHSMFSITSDGEIYTCEHLAGIKKFSTGNIFSGINKSRIKELQSINVERIEDCKKCWLRYLCSGGCFSANISSTGSFKNPNKEKCELIKIEWKFILSLYYEINTKFPDYFKTYQFKTKENEEC